MTTPSIIERLRRSSVHLAVVDGPEAAVAATATAEKPAAIANLLQDPRPARRRVALLMGEDRAVRQFIALAASAWGELEGLPSLPILPSDARGPVALGGPDVPAGAARLIDLVAVRNGAKGRGVHRLADAGRAAAEAIEAVMGGEPAVVQPARPKAIREPSPRAIAAYRAHRILGQKQDEVADTLATNQGQVSRWVQRVTAWIEAGHVLPELPVMASPVAIDPAVIEWGERQDALTRRQRARRDDDDE